MSAQAAPRRNVLILRGESPDAIGGRIVMDAIESSIRSASESPVEFYIETIDDSRVTVEDFERQVADLFAVKYSGVPLNLVVTMGVPALRFVLHEHARLFEGVPLLVGLVERRFVEPAEFPDKTSVVYVTVDSEATLRLALQVYPSARRVIVAGGISRYDRRWERVVREDLAPFESRIAIEYDMESSLDVLVRRAGALPPDTVMLYTALTRDSAGVPARPIEVLEALRRAATVPIFGIASTYLGHGIVGGAMVDLDRHGADLGRQAVRLLAGETPGPITTPAVTSVDWRELKRFGATARSLPAETRIAFKEPTLWERDPKSVFAAVTIFVAQTTLIFLLVRVGQRRRETQRQLRRRLRFERALGELSASLVPVPPAGIDAAVDAALTRVASLMEVDWVWRWDFGAPADAAWDSARLRCGQPELFNAVAELPPTLRERLQEAACADASAAAVPLAPAAVVSGALFWVSRSSRRSSRPGLDELQMLAVAVANVLRRKDDEAALERSDRLKGAILASLPAHVAVLNREGAVIAVNDARADVGNGNSVPEAIALASRRGRDEPASTELYRAVKMIEAVCRGASAGRQLEYRADRGTTECWYLMTAEPLRGDEQGAVVTHLDITERKGNEMALRESEDRFRRMSDALPVAVWMCDVEGQCQYCNHQWLQTTGRTFEEEAGSGWLEVVHPDDAARCLHALLEALRKREPLSTEYRVRRHDGQYRWFLASGVPRYGSDGAFHGFVGGSVDITEGKDAERSQRDLNRRLMVAQDQERRRIARELHDHLSQQLALLAIDLQQLAAHPPQSSAGIAPAIADAWRRTTEIASDVHAISHRLHPSKMEALGLVATINGHCRDVSRQTLRVRFEEQNVPARLSPDRALGLFRVVEEALSNVARHSGASEAQVTLRATDTDLVLRIADNGQGFTVAGRAATGLGLVSMRERVEALDGQLSVVSTRGDGTIVEARVPLGTLADAPAADAAPRGRAGLRMAAKNTPGRRAESA